MGAFLSGFSLRGLLRLFLCSSFGLGNDGLSGIRLLLTDGIENPEEKICTYQDDSNGKKYLRIETDNEETYESFVRT